LLLVPFPSARAVSGSLLLGAAVTRAYNIVSIQHCESCADESGVVLLRTECFFGEVDCKLRTVDMCMLDASEAVSASLWMDNGDILVATTRGLVCSRQQSQLRSGEKLERSCNLSRFHQSCTWNCSSGKPAQ
jgi:hypothetical protein